MGWRAERNVLSSHTIFGSWQFLMHAGNRKVQLLLSCCWVVALLCLQGAWEQPGCESPVPSALCSLLLTGTKQQTEDDVPCNTYCRVNRILIFIYTTPAALTARFSEEVEGKRRHLQNAIHTSNDSCSTGSIFTIAMVVQGCGFNFQFKLHSIVISQGLEFQKL